MLGWHCLGLKQDMSMILFPSSRCFILLAKDDFLLQLADPILRVRNNLLEFGSYTTLEQFSP